jgi:hypothetical protein
MVPRVTEYGRTKSPCKSLKQGFCLMMDISTIHGHMQITLRLITEGLEKVRK